MTKVQKPAGAAKAAAPAPEAPRQSVDTAAEAGLTQTQPEPVDEEEPEEAPRQFALDAFTQGIGSLGSEDFAAALGVMLAEADHRGMLSRSAPELEPEEEATPEDEHAHVRALLARYGLKQAWQDEEGNLHFDATHVATLNPDTLTLITVE